MPLQSTGIRFRSRPGEIRLRRRGEIEAHSFATTETEEVRPSGSRKRLGPDDTRRTCRLSLLLRSPSSVAFRRESDLNTSNQTLDVGAGIAFSRCIRIRGMFDCRTDDLAPPF